MAQMLRPNILQKVPRQGASGKKGGETWDWWIMHMILEILSHRTPPSCIAASILTICELLNPNINMADF